MSDKPKFTIVTPGYETAKFIDKMADSLKAQTFGDFEAIIVVEESQDGSLEKCQQIAAEDNRFIAVSQPKSGSGSSSYNYGIRHARGEYVIFVDGDDWIDPKSLEIFAGTLDKYRDVDVLLASGLEMYEKEDGTFQVTRKISNITRADEGRVMTGRELIVKVGRAMNYQVLNICRTEYLREHNLYFADGLQQEDTEWTPRAWFFAKRVCAVDFEFYNYRRWGGSVQSACSPKLLRDFSKIVNMQFDFYEKNDIPEDVLNVWRNQWISMVYWYFFNPQYVAKFPENVREEAFDNIVGSEEKWQRFNKIASTTSLPKRLALPLVKKAALKHNFALADCYFKWFYFPLVNLIKK